MRPAKEIIEEIENLKEAQRKCDPENESFVIGALQALQWALGNDPRTMSPTNAVIDMESE